MGYALRGFGDSAVMAQQSGSLLGSLNQSWSDMLRADGSKISPIGLSLASLGVMLEALQLLHQSAHWQVRGPTYYGDHLLFERLYKKIPKQIDSVGERTVNLGDARLVCPITTANLAGQLIAGWGKRHGSVESARELVALSFRAEQSFVKAVKQALAGAPASDGTQNLLQGIADEHEANLYLLQQRLVRGG